MPGQNKGFRLLEALVIALVATTGVCFLYEIVMSRPDVAGIVAGFVPAREIVENPAMLHTAMGILGATGMPHNLYLHSSIVQTRKYEENGAGKREAVRSAFIDSTVALSIALFINAAILIVAAATFQTSGYTEVAEIQDAYKLLIPSMQLSFVVFPLVRFTSDRVKMGEFVNPGWLKALAYLIATVIASLNVWLMVQTFRGGLS